jgi:lysophospholipase L1-like esterase
MPSANEGSGEGDIPLDPEAMGNESSGEAPSNMTPSEETPPAEETPAEETPPAQETPPEQPVAFNPCPTDGSPCRIMPLGDSITFGLGSQNPDGGYRVELFRQAVLDGHDMTFVGTNPAGFFGAGGPNGPDTVEGQPFPGDHDGISGDTIPGVSGRVDAAIEATDPDIILLHIGTNHLGGALPNGLLGQLGDLLDQIIADAPDALLVVAQIVPRRQGNDSTEDYNAGIPALVDERAAQGDHVALVDMYTPFVNNPNFATALLNDIVHPNNAGYAVMAETWYEAIEAFLP